MIPRAYRPYSNWKGCLIRTKWQAHPTTFVSHLHPGVSGKDVPEEGRQPLLSSRVVLRLEGGDGDPYSAQDLGAVVLRVRRLLLQVSEGVGGQLLGEEMKLHLLVLAGHVRVGVDVAAKKVRRGNPARCRGYLIEGNTHITLKDCC